MNRYFKTNEPSKLGNSRRDLGRDSPSNRIELPEFIPFNNDYDNNQQNRLPIPSPSRSSRLEQRSPNSNTDRFSDNHNNDRENGPSSRESHRSEHGSKGGYNKQRGSPAHSHNSRQRTRSPQILSNEQNRNSRFVTQTPDSRNRNQHSSPSQALRHELLQTFERIRHSPSFGQRRRDRSRSPQIGKHENPRRSPSYNAVRSTSPKYGRSSRSPPHHSRIEPPRQENDYIGNRGESFERAMNDRSRHGSSVFDRMSSPPPNRRFGESLRSADNNSNGSQPHFFRTVQVRTYEDAMYQSQNRQLDIDPRAMVRDQSPFNNNVRRVEPTGNIAVEIRPRVIGIDTIAEMRNIKDRLVDAETHCIGLETTVRSYEREIYKLRQIVRILKNDIETLHSNIR